MTFSMYGTVSSYNDKRIIVKNNIANNILIHKDIEMYFYAGWNKN